MNIGSQPLLTAKPTKWAAQPFKLICHWVCSDRRLYSCAGWILEEPVYCQDTWQSHGVSRGCIVGRLLLVLCRFVDWRRDLCWRVFCPGLQRSFTWTNVLGLSMSSGLNTLLEHSLRRFPILRNCSYVIYAVILTWRTSMCWARSLFIVDLHQTGYLVR